MRVGTREDLLAAAKKCLAERGYAKTTVRDIVGISGTNLAAINYHFHGREALLYQAMVESAADAVSTATAGLPEDGSVSERLAVFWERLTASFVEDRELWVANLEALTAALHSEELRDRLAHDQQRAREGLGAALRPDVPEAGAMVMTLLTGLLVQWMVDPERAPSAAEVGVGLAALG